MLRSFELLGQSNAPPLVEEFKEIAFMRLVPLHAVGWRGSDVQAVDVRGFEEFLDPCFVVGYGCHHQAGADEV